VDQLHHTLTRSSGHEPVSIEMGVLVEGELWRWADGQMGRWADGHFSIAI